MPAAHFRPVILADHCFEPRQRSLFAEWPIPEGAGMGLCASARRKSIGAQTKPPRPRQRRQRRRPGDESQIM